MLLDQAELVLRERGIDALSLRELAREAGVSHGAPRSHFIDRNALLDALAERGFRRLADAIAAAAAQARGDYRETLRAAARAGLDFAVSDAALLDLMFAAKVNDPPDAVKEAAERLFVTVSEVIRAGVAAGVFAEHEVGRLTLLWSATVQGASALVTSRRATIDQARAIVDDAIAVLLSGSLEGGAGT
ncbi:TetR/AcrR family transcriptional regulator [Streptomyces luomodiensis]|uniref:TetR/AcrR family transcriptional regulator n=1 Tax=Streptomyces luomodiensis TaxID=3026192 RepID=A0ABY9V4B8_9ACTN|nr:TetR/AcrR family transcriptional regulator [Streptomyces sp. SCA4-21]WNE98774.1 TetR/AcrR family transcriptional regulator [Streptomyces sp. SCA4-21]